MINAEYYRIDRDYYLTEILFLLEKKQNIFVWAEHSRRGTHITLLHKRSPNNSSMPKRPPKRSAKNPHKTLFSRQSTDMSGSCTTSGCQALCCFASSVNVKAIGKVDL